MIRGGVVHWWIPSQQFHSGLCSATTLGSSEGLKLNGLIKRNVTVFSDWSIELRFVTTD